MGFFDVLGVGELECWGFSLLAFLPLQALKSFLRIGVCDLQPVLVPEIALHRYSGLLVLWDCGCAR